MQIELISHILLIVAVIVAVVIDVRTTKIPNLITFPLAAVGIIFGFILGGLDGALMALAGWAIGAVAIVALANLPIGPNYAGGRIGMGDAKLMAASGAFLGPKGALILLLYFCLCYGAVSIVYLAKKVSWKQVAVFAQATISGAKVDESIIDASQFEKQRKAPIPVSIAVLFALLLTLVLREQTLDFLGFGSTNYQQQQTNNPI